MGRFDRKPFAKRALGHKEPTFVNPVEAAKKFDALAKAEAKRARKAAKRLGGTP